LLAALLAVAGLAVPVGAADAVRSEVDARRVGVQDQVTLTITVESGSLPDQVALPSLTNLRVVGGPGVSTQMSWVNGQASQSRSWTYALQPIAVGHAEVGPVRVRFGAGEQVAPAIPIDVVAGSVAPAQPPPSNDPFARDPFADLLGRRRPAAEPKLFVEAMASRSSVFVGEPILLTYYVYTQANLSGLQFADAPQYTGFWVEDLPAPQPPRAEQVAVDGVPYTRFAVMMRLLYPTKSGRLTIPASTLSLGVQRMSFFDPGGVVRRATKPVAVQVKPIPDEPGFSGGVGRFRASASVDKSTLAFGEAATLRFKVEGSGNLKWIDRPPSFSIPGAKVYPPQVKSDLQTRPTGIEGSRTWEFVVVPQTAGTLEIPALTFSYFDPAAGRLDHTTTAPLPLRVEAGIGTVAPAPPPVAGGLPARGGPLPLRADLEPHRTAGAWSGRMVGVVAACVLLLHGALWGAGRFAPLGRPGPGGAAAPRGARGALADLQRIGRDGMSKEKAAGVIEKAIHGVFGTLEGDESERAQAVRALLDDVHAVRYAPQLGDYSERLRELAARAGEVVRRWA